MIPLKPGTLQHSLVIRNDQWLDVVYCKASWRVATFVTGVWTDREGRCIGADNKLQGYRVNPRLVDFAPLKTCPLVSQNGEATDIYAGHSGKAPFLRGERLNKILKTYFALINNKGKFLSCIVLILSFKAE